ncbi:hypothetical protein DOT66_15940 [Ralstonia pseudosolanacearum]|uniref:hypothetical protein n=1 Tax=Ralstonia pseudosolanacearum TaxID=1310165 RepID=UPI0008DA752F|nr:hypothetical protein [Ralstonia pseudosolanacearum]AZU58362.1 hypothetical protein CFM90_19100 [Ralstonia solanacearum]MCK4138953.1 hypothetical protein [Ralstonia pseudosolanacearum]OHV01465.1 hypothetical protein BLA34_07770 [Ralstonia solanacearum]QVX41165.1 hypothetical protein J4H89_17170 [Ralstonia solanacearum]RAA07951.1 hypothetical protein DOT66_15940 [Ralstonia pseudosolanacearum]
MSSQQQTEEAWAIVHGQAKPEDKGVGLWLWEAIQGDFNDDRSAGQIAADMVISLIPIVDTICDIRDLCANIRAYRKDPNNKLVLFFIALTVVGFFPEIGSVVKGVVKIAFVYIRKYLKRTEDLLDATKLGQATNRALDAALPKIAEFLSNSKVVKWATKEGVPNIFKFCSKKLNELADTVNGSRLKAQFLEAADKIETLLGRLKHIVPASTREKLNDFLDFLGKNKQSIASKLEQFTAPIRTILRVTAKRLDDHAWIAFTQTHNKGWIAPMSQQGASQLMNKHPPSWVRLGDKLPHPAPTLKQAEVIQTEFDAKIEKLRNAGQPTPPKLSTDVIQTFEIGKLAPAQIKGPAKLYRVVDPTSAAGGIFWVDEKTFHSLKSRTEWREKLAVKPEWNQNGQYVVYEIPAGETLAAWKGPAASQKLEGTPYHLTGGTDQIVFYPSQDKFAATRPRIDHETGQPMLGRMPGEFDTRVEWEDITGRKVTTPLRDKATDPHVKGPYETGWGFADWNQQEAKGIIVSLPDDIQ